MIERALDYLWDTQEPDGSWWGRWGVNYLYGLGAAVPAIVAAGVDPPTRVSAAPCAGSNTTSSPTAAGARAAPPTRIPPSEARAPAPPPRPPGPCSPSSPSSRPTHPATVRGIDYLVRTQTDDGEWIEPHFTGTGFRAISCSSTTSTPTTGPSGRSDATGACVTGTPSTCPTRTPGMTTQAGDSLRRWPIERPTTPREAYRWCEQYARRHDENFTVVSFLLPKKLRRHFFAVYAFCRYTDDLGDEAEGDRLALLDAWEQDLRDAVAGDPRRPLLIALARTIERKEIPPRPLPPPDRGEPHRPARLPLRHLRGRPHLLQLLRNARRPDGPGGPRLHRRRAHRPLRPDLHRPPARELLAGRLRRHREGPHLPAARRLGALASTSSRSSTGASTSATASS